MDDRGVQLPPWRSGGSREGREELPVRGQRRPRTRRRQTKSWLGFRQEEREAEEKLEVWLLLCWLQILCFYTHNKGCCSQTVKYYCRRLAPMFYDEDNYRRRR
ncbi:hypothetical protein Nepgr_002090 [Nepenthes gracilis]|uniref:Uncharacterized protein n=1 Tax=Nepenthes gracilis TaxID=150966 RepID=A0AAD3P5N1_NEPGR|nr:hypothetical protein Nepgr_002090 [Nepenthes gracilis]